MKNLSNDIIIEAYKQTIELKLGEDFRKLLEKEIIRREIELNNLRILTDKLNHRSMP